MIAYATIVVLVLVLLALAFGAFHFEQPNAALLPSFSVEWGGVTNGMSRKLWDERRAETAAAMNEAEARTGMPIIPIGPLPIGVRSNPSPLGVLS